MSNATLYKWRAKFGGMDALLTTRMKELEDENPRIEKMYADERLKAEIIAEALSKKWSRHLSGGRWRSGPSRSSRSRLGWRDRHF